LIENDIKKPQKKPHGFLGPWGKEVTTEMKDKKLLTSYFMNISYY